MPRTASLVVCAIAMRRTWKHVSEASGKSIITATASTPTVGASALTTEKSGWSSVWSSCSRCAGLAAACDASGDGCSWTAFEQCYPLEDLGMDVGKALGEARCELATKCEWRNVTACMDASAAAGGDDDRPGADDFLP